MQATANRWHGESIYGFAKRDEVEVFDDPGKRDSSVRETASLRKPLLKMPLP
jgi:hypothetical protein